MGNPVRKYVTGLDANKGSPSVVGQVYYGYDANNLYFSPDGIAWVRYTTMPTGTLLLFPTSCPNGWTISTGMDEKFLRGAPTGVWIGLQSGGAVDHTHVMPDVIAHVHNIAVQAGIGTDIEGNHEHYFNSSNTTGSSTRPWMTSGVGVGYQSTTSGGAHTHAITMAAHNVSNAGAVSPNTNSADNMPPYKKYIMCRKD